jgi:hypothetical protein
MLRRPWPQESDWPESRGYISCSAILSDFGLDFQQQERKTSLSDARTNWPVSFPGSKKAAGNEPAASGK